MKRRLIAVCIASVMALSLLGCNRVEERFDQVDFDKEDIGVTIISHPLEAKQDGKVFATGTYPEIVLSDEYAKQFPNLQYALNDYNSNWKYIGESNTADYGNLAMEYPDENASGEAYVEETTADVVRADEHMFSVITYSYSYAGGAHPSHYTGAINIDVTSGDVLVLSEVVTDGDAMSKMIRKKMEEKYPDHIEEIDSYYTCNCAIDSDVFADKFNEDSYTWTLTDEGIHIYFSPYEIASYATGDMDIIITDEDIPGIIDEQYKPEPQDMTSIVKKETAEVSTVEPKSYSEEEDNNGEAEENAISIANPTWKRYVSDSAGKASEKHITLTETSKETKDWLDTDAWASEHGFDVAFMSYGDDNYYYAPANPGEYGYEYTTVYIYDKSGSNIPLYIFDLYDLCNGPDNKENRESNSVQYLHWAKMVDDILYVSMGQNGYASEEPNSSYVVAIDTVANQVLWRSDPLVSNALNFQIVDDTIICGYGFTDEPDYIYLLDRFTGEKVDQIKVASGPSQFEVVDDTLYVATYNTAYTYKINR